MSDGTHIEWTDATWNPITGCALVSPGCTNCYAMRLSGTRLKHHPSRVGLTRESKAGPVWTGEVRFNEGWLTQPLSWKKPRKIFVCAHGDLFAEGVEDDWLDRIFAVMALCPQHIFQVLTKRPERMRDYLTERWQPAPARQIQFSRGRVIDMPAETVGEDRSDQVRRACEDFLRIFNLADTTRDELWTDAGALKIMQWAWPLPNVWLGTSVEDQKRADERIPALLATPAAVRFISAEPLLGPIDLVSSLGGTQWIGGQRGHDGRHRGLGTPDCPRELHHHHDERCSPGLDWVIVGGESGPGARPMHPDWARSLRGQCAVAGVAFFFKQWGEWTPGENVERVHGIVETAGWWDGAWLLGHENLANTCGHGDDEPDLYRIGKHAAGRHLDGVIHEAMPVSSGRPSREEARVSPDGSPK